MVSWPSAILFDFDGVLVNSEPLHFLAMHEALRSEKVDLSEAEYYEHMIGFDDRGSIRNLFERRQLPLEGATFLRLLTKKGRAVMDLIQQRRFLPLSGVAECIRGLWRHYPLGICSGSRLEEIEAMLEGIALRDCFRVIVAAEDVVVAKPHPEGYLTAMRRIGEHIHQTLTPADCLVVEDAPSVIRSVAQAGFPTLGVTTTYPRERLTDARWVTDTLHPDVLRTLIPELRFLIQ